MTVHSGHPISIKPSNRSAEPVSVADDIAALHALQLWRG